jgi:hypothetical protein
MSYDDHLLDAVGTGEKSIPTAIFREFGIWMRSLIALEGNTDQSIDKTIEDRLLVYNSTCQLLVYDSSPSITFFVKHETHAAWKS